MSNNTITPEDKFTSKDLLKCCVIFFTVLIIKLFFIDIASVYGASMEPTLNEKHDKIIVQKVSHNYKNGDIIVFDSKENGLYIKRIIGIPNDVIEIKNGHVYVNNMKINEPYIKGLTFDDNKTYVVPRDNLFVLGDNRQNSKDSRMIGFINFNQVKGVGLYRFNIFKKQYNKL